MSKDESIPWELLKIKVPEGVPKEKGFFEISGTEASETVNSRVYAWFLDLEENPRLAPLFCDALLRVAREKLSDASVAKHIALEKFDCNLEESTSSQKRIDILLDDSKTQSAIIIENKIHADLRNDLLDYWKHVSYPDVQKLGVLLTLYPTEIPEAFKSIFINVTHLEWVEAIEFAGVPSGIPLYSYGMMTDFFNAIKNQSTSKLMNDQARFFFDHPAPVIRAKNCLNEAINYIKDEIRIVARTFELTPKFRRDQYCYLLGDKHSNDAYYTVIFEQLVQTHNPTIYVILELYENGVRHLDLLDQEVRSNLESDTLQRVTEKRRSYVHFRTKELSLNFESIASLSEILVRTIRNEFEPVMSIVHKTLDGLIEE